MEAKMVALKSGGMKWAPEMSTEEFTDAAEAYEGFCMICGETASGVEPDMHVAIHARIAVNPACTDWKS